IGHRIRSLRARLEKVNRQREQSRRQRQRREVLTVALVGYTNAGKSTLFNRLSGASVGVADQVFATLDPTLRKITLPTNHEAILVDTVGFIRDLPHELIAAFHSTLEETRDARLLLHVIDCADPEHAERTAQVEVVLEQIEANKLPVIQVYNKADILGVPPRIDRAETGMPRRVWVSAKTGAGTEELLAAIAEFLHQSRVQGTVRLDFNRARLRALLYDCGTVLEERVLDSGWELDVEIDQRGFDFLQRHEKLEFIDNADKRRSQLLH
ncbi:MAG: GTPase HflX, partial [Gammaproteobacteria bacterium]